MKEKISPLAVFGFFGALAFVLFLVLLGSFGLEEITLPDSATAATTSAVAVTARVAVDISCSSSSGSTAFGTFAAATITTSSPQASTTMACANAGSGCTLYVKDAGNATNGGLATTSPAFLIPSPNAAFSASTTLVTTAQGYGIQATSTAAGGSGASLTLGARYNVRGNDVGGLTVSNLALATANATTTGREVIVDHKAVITSSTQAGSYVDTITYECTAI